MPKLKIIYSPEFEIERIRYTLEKIEWYRSYGYKPSLPTELATISGILSPEEISKIVHLEYEPSAYEVQKNFLESHWKLVLENSTPNMDKILPFLQDEYIVYLTKYGTGGSYHYPNIIYANITYWWETGILRNILHEITHLAIHPLIEKYKIDHWQKERIVDLITLRLSEKYGRAQEIKDNISTVDKIFENFYPDIEKVIANVGHI